MVATNTKKLLRCNKQMQLFVNVYTSYIFHFHSLKWLPYNGNAVFKLTCINIYVPIILKVSIFQGSIPTLIIQCLNTYYSSIMIPIGINYLNTLHILPDLSSLIWSLSWFLPSYNWSWDPLHATDALTFYQRVLELTFKKVFSWTLKII